MRDVGLCSAASVASEMTTWFLYSTDVGRHRHFCVSCRNLSPIPIFQSCPPSSENLGPPLKMGDYCVLSYEKEAGRLPRMEGRKQHVPSSRAFSAAHVPPLPPGPLVVYLIMVYTLLNLSLGLGTPSLTP